MHATMHGTIKVMQRRNLYIMDLANAVSNCEEGAQAVSGR